MKLVQGKRRVLRVGECQMAPGPARLGMAGAAWGAHLAGVRVGMGRFANPAQPEEPCLRQFTTVCGEAVALVAPDVRVFAPEREGGAGSVERGQPAAGPALFGVALLARHVELSLMRVRVAVATGLADVEQADLHFVVHSPPSITFLT